jgi:DtxR family transcriptional regulator, Mn-dependent transcriptional regulator
MTFSEENYLKAIYHLSALAATEVLTNAISEMMDTKASSVTDMLKKLAEKELVYYKKYQGVSLTEKGKLIAKMVVRKHRLWEVFLVVKLGFTWDEVHDIAEQLEHIYSEKLVDKLDDFLENPSEDIYGHAIPNKEGEVAVVEKIVLAELKENQTGICVGVKDTSTNFLHYLDRHGIRLGSKIKLISTESFDFSLTIKVADREMTISNKIASNLFVRLV